MIGKYWFRTLLILCPALLLSTYLLARQSVFDQIDLLVDVRHEIVSDYVTQPDEQKMVESAVRAMIESLGDDYTVFLTPEELEPFDKQIRGTFSGIGAEVDLHENRLRIVTPLEDSPAWKAGILAGDIVLEIDGTSTLNMTISDAIKHLTGPQGTQVTLKVRHESGEEALITITRAQINVQTVRGWRRDAENHWDWMLDPVHKVGYVRLTQFTESTTEDLRAALTKMNEQGVQGLILDMRFNPGGLLEAAVDISDMFLPSGQRIVSVKGRAVPEQVQLSTVNDLMPTLPMVVLANEASASASEIVAGALSDNERAIFVGTRTFGKGSVQQVKMLENSQGALKITNAHYYLPKGRNIHRVEDAQLWGVDPHDGFYVPMTAEQYRVMIEKRRAGDVLRQQNNGSSVTVSPELIEADFGDLQLAAALRALQGKLTSNQWQPVGQSNATMLAKLSQRTNLQRQRDALVERLAEIDKQLAKLNQTGSTTQPATQPAESE